MFKKILVPLDGSDLAARALPFARRLAGDDGSLVLVRAAEAHVPPGADLTEAEVRVVREAEDACEAAREALRRQGVPAEWHVYYGPPAEGILGEARMRQADVIVMSTHGRGGFAKLAYGSVAEEVLRHAATPVLLIPARCQRSWEERTNTRIMVPLDGSVLAESALEPAEWLAQRLKAGLMLIGVVELPGPTVVPGSELYVQEHLNELRTAQLDYLTGVAARVRARGIGCSALCEVAGPASAIAAAATNEDVLGIVMATHGRTGLARLVMGSVATGVIQRSVAPVLVVRPAAMAAEAAGMTEVGAEAR